MTAGRFALVMVAIAAISGCSKNDDGQATDSAEAVTADTAGMNAATAPQSGAGDAAPVAVADIEKWQRGMAAELQAVQAAGEKFRASTSSSDSLTNMMGSNEMSTLDAGAQAAGLNPERYKFVRSTLSQVALALSPLELEADMSAFPPGFADQLKAQGAQNLERMKADAPTEVVEAMRPRALELRKQHTDLVAARLRAAGMAQ